jgi:hypothetical protein
VDEEVEVSVQPRQDLPGERQAGQELAGRQQSFARATIDRGEHVSNKQVACHTQMPSSLAGYHYDYDDSFAAPRAAADDRTPEQWARAVFEDAPRPVRWFLVNGFRYGLGLRLASTTSHGLTSASQPRSTTLRPSLPIRP